MSDDKMITPADHAASVQAERAAAANIARHWPTGILTATREAIAEAILARGDTSALAGLLAEEFHKGWRKGQDDALESAKPEIAATASALAAAVEAARDEGRIEGATLAAAELAAAVEAARREGVEQAARWHDDRAVARRHAGLDQAADEHTACSAAIRARFGGREGA